MAPGPPRPSGTPIGVRLAQSAKQVNRAFDEHLGTVGGSAPTWLILVALKNQPTANQRALAATVGIHSPTLTHHLNSMEAAGLVTRRRDPSNRRIHIVELTAAGHAAFDRMLGAVIDFDRRLRSGFRDDEIEQLASLLERLSGNVASQ